MFKRSRSALNPEEILQAEFDYISSTVFQANEDRARVASFFFISVGSLVASILGILYAEEIPPLVYGALSLIFSVETALALLTIAQLARLRAAWYESIKAMNQIKEHYIALYPEIEPAFAWRMTPQHPGVKKDKPLSIANLLAVEVSMLGALTIAASGYFLLNIFGELAWWGWGSMLLLAVGGYFGLLRWYRLVLNHQS
ncbi:MAG: hypothetical protein JXB85_15870 [Anaerolineales bacterium]|nr:hypothetical protein [Anaerolineales bacterium]